MPDEIEKFDITVVGAGVVGLAIAKTLLDKAPSSNPLKLLILDKNVSFGEETSSRNSEVIHAGIYYPEGSLKSQLCIRGKALLYDYARQRNIDFKAIGKLIVATQRNELAALDRIKTNASNNGVSDLKLISTQELLKMEPHVNAMGALFSPSTGIINCHQLMLQLLTDIEHKGGLFVAQTCVTSVCRHPQGFMVKTKGKAGEPYQFQTSHLINAAGLGAQTLAENIEGLSYHYTPQLHLCKGSYFGLAGNSPFQHLIYPVPDSSGAGLGIHATLDLGGQVKFGPNTRYLSSLDYQVEEESKVQFEKAIKRYYPGLDSTQLTPAFAGIRPKLQGPNDDFKDFVIQTEIEHGIPGLIQLFGIESPGLTSCLAIGEKVNSLL